MSTSTSARESLRCALPCLFACAAWGIVAWLSGVQVVRADEVSGTWTGELEAHGNYFLERSTRVFIPTARVALASPHGVRVDASYLVDVISSASIAQGASDDKVFTELRHGVGAGAGKTFAVGDSDLDLSIHGTYSTEDDYKSRLYGANASFAFNEKNSVISLGLMRVSDTIEDNRDATFRAHLRGVTTQAGFSQVLSKSLVLSLGYQFVVLSGFLGNPYRSAQFAEHAPVRESPPDERYRHNWELQLSWFSAATDTALQAYARYYTDSWSIHAITPELRLYQSLGRDVNVRLRFRYYSQSSAEFAPPLELGRYEVGYQGPTTGDPKLMDFDSQQLGVRVSVALSALSNTFLGFASRGAIDVQLDRQWCTSAFGNNVMATLGGRLPF